MIEDPVTEMDDRLELSGAGMKRCSNFTNWGRVLQKANERNAGSWLGALGMGTSVPSSKRTRLLYARGEFANRGMFAVVLVYYASRVLRSA